MNEARKIVFNPDPEAVRAFAARMQAAQIKAGTRERVMATITRAIPHGIVEAAMGQPAGEVP